MTKLTIIRNMAHEFAKFSKRVAITLFNIIQMFDIPARNYTHKRQFFSKNNVHIRIFSAYTFVNS